jgi:DNA-binding beta-propeller fold protein YncE
MADLTGMLQAAAGGVSRGNAWDLDFASFEGINRGPTVAGYETTPTDVKFNNDGTRMYVLGTTRDAVLQYDLGTAYQPSTAVFPSKSVAAEEVTPQGVEFKPDGTKMYVVGSVGNAVNEYDLSTAWDVTTASYVQNFSVSSQVSVPSKVRFKDDGTKMYVLGNGDDTVYQYSLSSAWDISTASYDSVSFSVTSQEATPNGMFFGDSGAKMYIVGDTNDTVYQYTLSTPWDLSTASYASLSFSVASQETSPQDVFFKSDGTIMYVMGQAGDDVNQYALSSAWDVSSASYTKVSSSPTVNVWFGEGAPRGMYIKPDGTQFYFVGANTDAVWQQTMPTAWDVANMVPGFYVGSQEGTPQGLAFKDDGTKMYIVGSGNDTVYQYSLSTAWDVLTASYDSVSFSVATQDTNPRGITFKTDGTKMYILGAQGLDVNEYDLGTAWNISTASYVQNFSVSTQAGAQPWKVEFKSDGVKMFISSDSNDAIYEYALSSAWNISTASYSSVSYSVGIITGEAPFGLAFADSGTKMYIVGQSVDRVQGFPLSTAWDLSTANSYYRSVEAQEANPQSVTFKPDGTEMYVLGASGDDVNQYSVSTAWSVQSASYVRVFSVSGQAGAIPAEVQFKDDGTKMYVLSNTNDAIYQYSLSTAWDISTATYDSVSFSVTSQEDSPRGMFFGDAGTKLYVVGLTSDTVFQYTLSTPWDLSTASYASKSFSVASQETTPTAVFLGDNGSKMYIVGQSNNTIYQYTLSTPWDVSTASYANKSFSVVSYEATSNAIWFKDDGTRFYVTGGSSDIVWEFTIS